MTEYWANVYLEEGIASLGRKWETTEEVESAGQGRANKRAYRIHVKLKEQPSC